MGTVERKLAQKCATFFARTPKRSVLMDSSSCFWLGLMHTTMQVRALPPSDSAVRVSHGSGPRWAAARQAAVTLEDARELAVPVGNVR
jgi:hypothetical protein